MSGQAWCGSGWCRAVVAGAAVAAASFAEAAGTDLVRVGGAGVVRGSVLSRQADGSLLVAVRRAWLADAEPGLAREAAAKEAR